MELKLERRKKGNRRVHTVAVNYDRRQLPDRRDAANEVSETYLYKNDLNGVYEKLKHEEITILDFLKHLDNRKAYAIRSSFAVFSIIISALVAIYTFSHRSGETMALMYPFNALFAFVLIGLGAANLVIIKLIMNYRAGLLLAFRQANCIRQAIDRVFYTMLEGRFPKQVDDLRDKETIYWDLLGQHRKLPIDNTDLRAQNNSWYKSSDEFAVTIIAVFTTVLFIGATLHVLLYEGESTVIGVVSGASLMFFLLGVIWIVQHSRNAVNKALESDLEKNNGK